MTTATDIKSNVVDLNAGWYNTVASALKLDPKTFLLAQGTLGLQSTDSSGLYLMSDAVPPPSSVAYFDSSGLSKRSSAYTSLLGALLPETGTDLRAILGDMYGRWLTYRDNFWDENPTSVLTQQQLFEQWANRFLEPRKSQQAVNTYKQAENCQLNHAIDAVRNPSTQQEFISTDNERYKVYRYSANLEAAVAALNAGQSATIDFESRSMDTKFSHKTILGAATGFYRIFSGGASANLNQLDLKAADEGWSIHGHIGQYATLRTEPADWFNSAELIRAFNGKNDNSVWDPMAKSSGTWDTFFSAQNGSLARRISQFVLVSDYEITVTSHAKYSSMEYERIHGSAKFGVWPFFSGSAQASQSASFVHNSDDTLSITNKLPKGLVQIWGVNVQEAPH